MQLGRECRGVGSTRVRHGRLVRDVRLRRVRRAVRPRTAASASSRRRRWRPARRARSSRPTSSSTTPGRRRRRSPCSGCPAARTTPIRSRPRRSRSLAGHSLRYENVLTELFGLEPDSVGALKMTATTESVIGMSRTYNIPGAKAAGTFGQGLPAIRATDMIRGTEPRHLIFLSENDDSRANVGCVNGTAEPVRISLDVYDAEGTFLETKSMDLGPYSNNQINRIFRDHAPVNGSVDVRADSDDAALLLLRLHARQPHLGPDHDPAPDSVRRDDLHPGRGARRRPRGRVLRNRRRPRQRRLHRPDLPAAVAAARSRQQRSGRERHLLARRGRRRALRQRARRGLRPRAGRGRRAGGGGERRPTCSP